MAKSKISPKPTMTVKFLEPVEGYRKEDCATFDVDKANGIISMGFAEEINIEDTSLEEVKSEI